MFFTTEDVKNHLAITANEHDPVLEAIVKAIHGDIARYTDRALEQGTITAEKHVGDLAYLLFLRQYPLVSVTQLKIGGFVTTDYEIDDLKSAALYRSVGWDKPANPMQRNIEVTYVAGYATDSDEYNDIKLAGIEWASARFRLRQKVEVMSESHMDHSTTYERDMPMHARNALDRFRRRYG